MFFQTVFKWMFIISLLVMGWTYFYKDKLPDPVSYDAIPLPPPIQTPTTREPFVITANKQHYEIIPQFDYDLTGVVVTYNNADGFTDIWHYDIWKDFINIRDLCVIWNPNVQSGAYKNIRFSSDTWTCWLSWEDSQTTQLFKEDGFSNNHLLTDNMLIKNSLSKAEIGDVIHFKGVLARYKNLDNGGERGTSIRRDDSGNGACETVYLDEFSIVKKANTSLRRLFLLSKWVAIISLLGFMVMFIRTPHKTRH